MRVSETAQLGNSCQGDMAMNNSVDPGSGLPDPYLHYERFRQRALRDRNAYLRERLPSAPRLALVARRKVRTFIAAFAVATGAFSAVLLNNPPTTIASDASPTRFSPNDLPIPADLPTLTGADPF